MAEGFQVSGPTKVQVCLLGDNAAFVDLGHTDNDDLIDFDEEDHYNALTSNETGEMTADVVFNGSTGMLAMSLVKWDEVVLDKIKTRQRQGVVTGTDPGKFAEVGKLLVADSRFFGVKLLTTRTGMKSYTFKRTWMPIRARKHGFGNIGQRKLLVFHTLPDTSTGKFYDEAVNA